MNTKYILVIALAILGGVFYFIFSSKDLVTLPDTQNQSQENIVKDPEILPGTTSGAQESILKESDIDMPFEGDEYRNFYPSFSVKIPSSFEYEKLDGELFYFNEYTRNEEEGFKKVSNGRWIKAQIIVGVNTSGKYENLDESLDNLVAINIATKVKDINLDGCSAQWISLVNSPNEIATTATTQCLYQNDQGTIVLSLSLISKEEVFSAYMERYEAMLSTFYFSDFIFEDLTEQEQQFSKYILREGEIPLDFSIDRILGATIFPFNNPQHLDFEDSTAEEQQFISDLLKEDLISLNFFINRYLGGTFLQDPKNPGLLNNEVYKDFFEGADPQNVEQIFLSIYVKDKPPRSPHQLGIAVIQYKSEEKLNLDAIKIKDSGLRGKSDAILFRDNNILVLVYSDWDYYPKEARYVADGLKARLNLQEI